VVGIKSCGVYIPFNRLERKRICEAYSKKGDRGEKAVASYDEDSITMAVAAAADCCGLVESPNVQGVYMASTTLPYKEKQCATVVAAALDVGQEVKTADFASSLRCGSTAMISAFAEAEKGNDMLVTASDRRTPFLDGANELLFGDGAAAFVLGSENLIAELKGSLTISRDFYDLWRSEGEPFVKSWEDRFAITQQYMPVMKKAAAQILEQCGLEAKDIAKAVIYAHTARYQGDLARALGFTPEQLQDCLYESIGNTGCAAGPIMLCAALENSKPGDKILYLGYGEGCDAMIFETTEAVADLPKRVKEGIEHKRTTMPYEKYLRWRGLLSTEPQRRPPLRRMSLPEYYRVPGKNFALYGTRCVEYLFGYKASKVYQILFCLFACIAGSVELDLAWAISDTLNGLMAVPNLLALALLSPVVIKLSKEYFDQVKANMHDGKVRIACDEIALPEMNIPELGKTVSRAMSVLDPDGVFHLILG